MTKCDAVDGLKDGLIDDPRACRFDPARDVPACGEGADAADCLTAAQASTIGKIYSGPISKGEAVLSRIHDWQRGREHGSEWHDVQRVGRGDCRRAAEREAG
jgi:feruloyl esterase